jgi:hypothetical protein
MPRCSDGITSLLSSDAFAFALPAQAQGESAPAVDTTSLSEDDVPPFSALGLGRSPESVESGTGVQFEVTRHRELTTDLPDVSESPFTIDAGHVQFETTLFAYARTRADADGAVFDRYELGTTNLRIGLADRWEVNVVWQPYGIVEQRDNGASDRGIGSVDLRAKYNLWGNEGLARRGDTALTLLPYVTLPTDRDNGISARFVEFGIIVPLAIELGEGFGLGINGAANFSREDGDRTYGAAVLTSASLAHDWGNGLGSFAEVVWEFSRNKPLGDIVSLNTGQTLALNDDLQLDLGVSFGATRASDRIASFAGISARF